MSSYVWDTSGGAVRGGGVGEQQRRALGLPPLGEEGGEGPLNLAEERKKILSLFQNDQGFYNQGPANDLRNMIMGRSSGADSPYSRSVMQSMFDQNAQGANGMFQTERDMLQRSFGNNGLSGSGGETRALITAKTRAQQQLMAGRRDITSRAALENFNARERGQTQAQSFLGQQAAHQQAGAFAEAGFRSQATQSQERPGPAASSGPQFLGSGATFDQGEWDRTIQDVLKRMEAVQQNGVQGTTGGIQAAPVPGPSVGPGFGVPNPGYAGQARGASPSYTGFAGGSYSPYEPVSGGGYGTASGTGATGQTRIDGRAPTYASYGNINYGGY